MYSSAIVNGRMLTAIRIYIHFSNLINDNDLLIASIIAQVHT